MRVLNSVVGALALKLDSACQEVGPVSFPIRSVEGKGRRDTPRRGYAIDPILAENTITPTWFQVPRLGCTALDTVWGGPPAASIFSSFP